MKKSLIIVSLLFSWCLLGCAPTYIQPDVSKPHTMFYANNQAEIYNKPYLCQEPGRVISNVFSDIQKTRIPVGQPLTVSAYYSQEAFNVITTCSQMLITFRAQKNWDYFLDYGPLGDVCHLMLLRGHGDPSIKKNKLTYRPIRFMRRSFVESNVPFSHQIRCTDKLARDHMPSKQ